MLTLLRSLIHKFTASGDYFVGASEHLHRLGLKQHAIDSGAAELGRQIRQHFIKPFRMASVVGSRTDHHDSGPAQGV